MWLACISRFLAQVQLYLYQNLSGREQFVYSKLFVSMSTRDVGTQTPTFYIMVYELEKLRSREQDLTSELSDIQKKLTGLDDQIKDGLRELRETLDKKMSELEGKLSRKADISTTQSRGFGTVGRLDTRLSALERSVWNRQGWR